MASASQPAAQVVAASRLLTSFSVCPCPTASPTNTVLEPIVSSTGRTRAKAAGSPAAMTESVPASAPATPPLTGASRAATPRGARPSATSFATRAPVVERSTYTRIARPSAKPPGPSATALTTAGVGRLTSTTSASAATAAALPRASAPPDAAAASAAGLVSWARTRWPAASRRRTMGAPMTPRPTKPSVGRPLIAAPAGSRPRPAGGRPGPPGSWRGCGRDPRSRATPPAS